MNMKGLQMIYDPWNDGIMEEWSDRITEYTGIAYI